MKLSKRWLAVAAGAIVVVLAWRALVHGPGGIEVEAMTVARGPVEDAVTNSQAGTVKSRQRSRLGAEAGGRVTAILRREGAQVRRGEPLVQLDELTARGQLELARRDVAAARAGLASAQAAATLAHSEFERASRLFRDRLTSQETMDQARSRDQSAAAGLEGAQAQLDRAGAAFRLAETALAKLWVLSPFDGVVTQRFVEVGETVVPGQPLLEVLDPDSLYVSAPIDEMDIGRLRVGQPGRVTLDPYPGVVWGGTVTRVAPFVNDVLQQNRTLEIEVALPPAPGHPVPKPGASADVEIVLRHQDDVLRVPTAAVLEGHRVLVVERGKARSREVKVGLHDWQWSEVLSGLRGGETVITTLDRQGLKEGTAVVVRTTRGATEPAGDGRGAAGGP
jgi:HlyD family secretion protein